jgi:capsular polysaccharide biosynthesis protein
MELGEYWRVFRRRAWIPMVLTVLAAAGASALTFLSEPQYIATATVLAKTPNGGSPITFTDVATSNDLGQAVQKQLNLQESVDQIVIRIRVSPSGNDLFKLSVTDTNAQRAADIANTAAAEAVVLYQDKAPSSGISITALDRHRAEFRDRYKAAAQALITYQGSHKDAPSGDPEFLALQLDMQAAADSYVRFEQEIAQVQITTDTDPNTALASVVDGAVPVPDTSARLLRIVYASGLAILLGIGLVLLVEYFDRSVRSPEQAEQLVGIPVLGVIPRTKLRPLHQRRSAG